MAVVECGGFADHLPLLEVDDVIGLVDGGDEAQV